jgi:hypothetical protein
MAGQHIAVVGSGSLTRSICHSLAALAPPRDGRNSAPIRVTVLARNALAADDIARACHVRAAVSGANVHFAAELLADEVDALTRLRPDVLVCCASTQSPYEKNLQPSAWTRLIEEAGFGLTLPFQAHVVVRLARAVAQVSPGTLLINGCFPDAVNPLLAALGLPVHCGIGNVATLAACLQAALDLPDQLAVLGHHVHLAAPGLARGASERSEEARDTADEVLVWRDGERVPGVTALLAAARALPRTELNAIAGHAAARLLLDLLSGAEICTNLPGPLGLPGGYPVRLAGDAITLNLPAGLSRADAIDWNIRAGHRDGVEVRDGRVSYPPQAAAALATHLPDLAEGWAATALDEVSEQLTALRRRLRLAQPIPV